MSPVHAGPMRSGWTSVEVSLATLWPTGGGAQNRWSVPKCHFPTQKNASLVSYLALVISQVYVCLFH